jgi:hypothetical protein
MLAAQAPQRTERRLGRASCPKGQVIVMRSVRLQRAGVCADGTRYLGLGTRRFHPPEARQCNSSEI